MQGIRVCRDQGYAGDQKHAGDQDMQGSETCRVSGLCRDHGYAGDQGIQGTFYITVDARGQASNSQKTHQGQRPEWLEASL